VIYLTKILFKMEKRMIIILDKIIDSMAARISKGISAVVGVDSPTADCKQEGSSNQHVVLATSVHSLYTGTTI
jgi:hypothetical protein